MKWEAGARIRKKSADAAIPEPSPPRDLAPLGVYYAGYEDFEHYAEAAPVMYGNVWYMDNLLLYGRDLDDFDLVHHTFPPDDLVLDGSFRVENLDPNTGYTYMTYKTYVEPPPVEGSNFYIIYISLGRDRYADLNVPEDLRPYAKTYLISVPDSTADQASSITVYLDWESGNMSELSHLFLSRVDPVIDGRGNAIDGLFYVRVGFGLDMTGVGFGQYGSDLVIDVSALVPNAPLLKISLAAQRDDQYE